MNEDFNLYPLHVFRLVVRHGSVSRAEQELFISQPAVSTHIKALEARYREPLFERTSRGMLITPAGAVVSEYANRGFALIATLMRRQPSWLEIAPRCFPGCGIIALRSASWGKRSAKRASPGRRSRRTNCGSLWR